MPRTLTSSMTASGPSLLTRVADGDRDALAALFRDHATDVHRVATLVTLSADEADDVVQDVFIGLPDALRRYTDRGSFASWLRVVTTRVALMRLRARRSERVDDVDPSVLVELASVEQPDRVTLPDALARLSAEQRAVFVLKAIEGYRHEEIAEALGISRGASQARLFRAVETLRTLLGDSNR